MSECARLSECGWGCAGSGCSVRERGPVGREEGGGGGDHWSGPHTSTEVNLQFHKFTKQIRKYQNLQQHRHVTCLASYTGVHFPEDRVLKLLAPVLLPEGESESNDKTVERGWFRCTCQTC
jgi:hypothetical protein